MFDFPPENLLFLTVVVMFVSLFYYFIYLSPTAITAFFIFFFFFSFINTIFFIAPLLSLIYSGFFSKVFNIHLFYFSPSIIFFSAFLFLFIIFSFTSSCVCFFCCQEWSTSCRRSFFAKLNALVLRTV